MQAAELPDDHIPVTGALHTGISVEQHPIGRIFSDRYVFSIPPYQRPYAWTDGHADLLFDDLWSAARIGEGGEAHPYFLGSIVLVKGERPDSQVIDGQQRLITLTILLAVLRATLPEEYRESITQRLYAPADPLIKLPARYRLQPKEHDAEFFRDYIQSEHGIVRLEGEIHTTLSDSQRNMLENARVLLREARALSEAERVQLAQFVMERCLLIVVSTADRDSAFRIFTVLNNRGLDLTQADILKAEVVGPIPEREQHEYTARWETTEESLGRKEFNELLSHLGTIFRRQTTRSGTIADEFRRYVIGTRTPQQVIDKIIVPAGAAFSVIRNQSFPHTEYAEGINNQLFWLNQIDNFDWVPPAMLYVMRHKEEPEQVLHFLADLERLAASLMIRRQYAHRRGPRYARVLAAIERDEDLWTTSSPLQLTEDDRDITLATLQGDIYLMWSVPRQYILLRLDALLADTPRPTYQRKTLTVEHVLPRTPRADSEWTRTFTASERGRYVHRLGNLALLSRAKNAQASNYDFSKKRDTYLRPANGIPPYALTAQVLAEQEWTPAVIERRQRDLVGRLKSLWRL